MKAPLYVCTAKKATCFMPRYYPKPTGYVHIAVCCIGRYQGDIKALFRPYSGCFKELLRLFYGTIQALLYIYAFIHTCVCVCVCV